jgi:ribose transport system ATP-binding protein
MDVAAPPLLAFRSVCKRYGATTALDDVSFELQPAEVCGLLGENGAGKSTLVKILSGVVAPDSGTIRIDGKPFLPGVIADARARGVSTAFQELSLVPTLSVAVNLFLPRPAINRFGLVSTRRIEADAEQVLQQHGVTDISPSALVGDLPLGMRQKVEIVRAFSHRPKVLLLDEPTAALSDRQWLFSLIARALRDRISILYISHKLDEIRQLCSRCVILRNGRKILDSEVAALSDDAIFSSMAGRSVGVVFAHRSVSVRRGAPPLLHATHLKGPGIDDVGFSLASGEIVGVAGLEGQGQSRLFKALVGLSPLQRGEIGVEGTAAAIRSPRAAHRLGIVLVPEERKSEGLFNDLTTVANISLPVIDQASRLHLISKATERRRVETVLPAVKLPERYLALGIGALSGGNQQKAILARALLAGAKCLLLFDPTRGVDVGAKQHIYSMMLEFVRGGGAILFYSTELDELVGLCDRCLVLYRGAIAGELARAELSQDVILALASGHSGGKTGRANPQAHA